VIFNEWAKEWASYKIKTSLLVGLIGGKMFLYTGHLMTDIWFSNIYFHDFDDKEYQNVGLSHGSSIKALLKQEMYGYKSNFHSNLL
jgi:hypothetical protein